MTTLIIWNEEKDSIMKTFKSPEKSCLLIKDVSKTVKNEAREKRGGFLGTLLGIPGISY